MWPAHQRGVHRGVHKPRWLFRSALCLRGPWPCAELSLAVPGCVGACAHPRHGNAGAAQAAGPQRRQRHILRRRGILRGAGVAVHGPPAGLLAERHGPRHAALPGPVPRLPFKHHGHHRPAGARARRLRDPPVHTARKRRAEGAPAGHWWPYRHLPRVHPCLWFSGGRSLEPLRSRTRRGLLAVPARPHVHWRLLLQQGPEACHGGRGAGQEALRAEVQLVCPVVAANPAGHDAPLGRGLLAPRRHRRGRGELCVVRCASV
mmetsp:Transcript_69391/g.206714  ORF Transcript_69391/g.206714 Transcript_69391/m.206714 type:complete len:261 (-) Transcript_69391:173-955(-)